MKRQGFTSLELLVSLVVVAVLVTLLGVGAREMRRSMDKANSVSNLRQLAQGALLYVSDNNGLFPPTVESKEDGMYWWFGFESWQSSSSGEGNRVLEPEKGPLGAYLQNFGEIGGCPMFIHSARLKPKYANTIALGYGYNEVLAPHPWVYRQQPEGRKRLVEIEHPARTVLFITSAQVNTFQAPASSKNPMLEEFYFVNEQETTAHFRFGGKAAAAMVSGHVEFLEMHAGTQDNRLKSEQVGRLAPKKSFQYLK